MKRQIATVAVTVLATVGVQTAMASSTRPTIAEIEGSQAHGFHVVWESGRQDWMPSRSEELSYCGEYDSRIREARCRGSVNTKYRWMAIARRSVR